MNTRIVMRISAGWLGLAGLALSFAPGELLRLAGPERTAALDPLLLQLLGAGYLGLAFLDWVARNAVLGGIYGRPVVLANFTHFLVGGLALAKGYRHLPTLPVLLAGLGYLLLAAAFGRMLMRHPLPDRPPG